MYSVKLAQTIGGLIGILGIVMNCIMIFTVIRNRKRNLNFWSLGYCLIIALGLADIIAPLVSFSGLVVNYILDTVLIYDPYLCQIFGALQNTPPFISSWLVTLLALDRYLIVNQSERYRPLLVSIFLALIGIGLVMVSLTAYNFMFRAAPSELLCSTFPSAGIWVGKFWYYYTFFSFLCSLIITVIAYIRIVYICKRRDDSLARLGNENLTTSSLVNGSIKARKKLGNATTIVFSYTKFFRLWGTIICYSVCMIPGVTFFAWEIVLGNTGAPGANDLSPAASATVPLSILSLTLFNPILVLLLNSVIYAEFKDLCSIWYHSLKSVIPSN